MEDKYKQSEDIDDMVDEPCRSCVNSQVSAARYPCNECLHMAQMFGGQTI